MYVTWLHRLHIYGFDITVVTALSPSLKCPSSPTIVFYVNHILPIHFPHVLPLLLDNLSSSVKDQEFVIIQYCLLPFHVALDTTNE